MIHSRRPLVVLLVTSLLASGCVTKRLGTYPRADVEKMVSQCATGSIDVNGRKTESGQFEVRPAGTLDWQRACRVSLDFRAAEFEVRRYNRGNATALVALGVAAGVALTLVGLALLFLAQVGV